MTQRVIQIKKKPKPEPKPEPNHNHIIIKKKTKAPKPEPKAHHHIVINKRTKAPKPEPNPIDATHPIRVAAHHSAPPRLHKHKHKSNPMLKLIPIGIALLVVIILSVVVAKNKTKPTQRRVTSEYSNEEEDAPDNHILASIALAETKEWVKENPDNFDAIIARFQQIIDKYPNEISSKIAARHIIKWVREKQKDIDACMDELVQKCKVLISDKKYEEAITEFIDYDGKYVAETEARRRSNADKIRKVLQKKEVVVEINVLDRALNTLLSDGIEGADVFVQLYSKRAENLIENKEWQQLIELLDSAKKVPTLILKSFENQIGETVTVELITGKTKIQISSVKNGKIQHFKKNGSAKIIKEISLDHLSDKEKLQRLKDNLSGIALIKAIDAAHKKDFITAKEYLELAPSPLKEHLIEKLDQSQISKESTIASLQIAQALQLAKININPPDNFNAALTALESTKLSSGMKLLLYSVAKNVQRSSSELPWYKEADNYALMSHLLNFKPSEGEASGEQQDNSSDTDDNYDSDENSKNESLTEKKTDDANFDWRKEIDF